MGLVCTGLSALFIDDGDIDHLPSLISLKFFLGLPTDWTPLEAGTEKPVGVIHAFRLLGQIASWKRGESRSLPLFLQHKVYVPCIALTRLSFTSENYTCGWVGWPHTPDHEPPKSMHCPPSHGHLPQPSQVPAWNRCTVNVTGPPDQHASGRTSQLAFPKIGPCFVPVKGLAFAQQQQRHFGRWRETAERREFAG